MRIAAAPSPSGGFDLEINLLIISSMSGRLGGSAGLASLRNGRQRSITGLFQLTLRVSIHYLTIEVECPYSFRVAQTHGQKPSEPARD